MLKRLSRLGLTRGFLGDSRFWFWVGVGAWSLRILGRLVGKQPKVVYEAELEPGQTLVISDLQPLEARGPGKRVKLES